MYSVFNRLRNFTSWSMPHFVIILWLHIKTSQQIGIAVVGGLELQLWGISTCSADKNLLALFPVFYMSNNFNNICVIAKSMSLKSTRCRDSHQHTHQNGCFSGCNQLHCCVHCFVLCLFTPESIWSWICVISNNVSLGMFLYIPVLHHGLSHGKDRFSMG